MTSPADVSAPVLGPVVRALQRERLTADECRDLDHRLMVAVSGRRLDDVHVALADGANPDVDIAFVFPVAHAEMGDSLVTYAAHHALFATTKALVAAGASLDRPGRCIHRPLHAAILQRNLPLAQWLVGAGADPQTTNARGQTAFQIAVHQQYYELVRTMLDRHPDLARAPWSTGDTPLHEAVRLRDPILMNLLLAYGASPVARNQAHMSAFHEAVYLRRPHGDQSADCLRILLTTGVTARRADGKDHALLRTALLTGAAACAVVLLQHGLPFTDDALVALDLLCEGSPDTAAVSGNDVLQAFRVAVLDGTLSRDVVAPLLRSARATTREFALLLLGAPTPVARPAPCPVSCPETPVPRAPTR